MFRNCWGLPISLLLGIVLSACGPAALPSPSPAPTSPPPPDIVAAPSPTSTSTPSVTPTPTAVPSTATFTPVPPTATATVRPTATLAAGQFIATKAEDIAGLWQGSFTPGGGAAFIRYRLDGTFSIADTIEGLEKASAVDGKFSFDGTTFRTRDELCGKTGYYEVRVTMDGATPSRLSYRLNKDPCPERAADSTRGDQWVGP